MLLSNALSVSALQWAVMPVLDKVLDPWLRADRKSHARLVYGGLA
jgi:antibiotic biosynthesis monooxygenase (ABM) superfamily enzyme